jgi:predicted HD superfamily hydrolase involved in NAD metabolism
MSDSWSNERQYEVRQRAEPLGTSPCDRPGFAPYCTLVRRMVTAERFAHIERVAALAETIARANRFSAGELRATRLAALLHDVARDLPDERLVALAPPECELEREHPLALHGRAGRRIAQDWGVRDARVLDAIEGHVFGVRGFDRVGMALYVADVSEPGRGVNDEIRALALRDLCEAYRRAIAVKVSYLRRCGKGIHPRTLQVHDEISSVS